METRIVRTKDELKRAVEEKVKRFVVKGELAESLHTAIKIKRASKWAIGLLAASLATAPITGGLSLVAATPIAALTGIEIVAIIAVAALGISLVLVICKEFKTVKFKGKQGDIEAELELEREASA